MRAHYYAANLLDGVVHTIAVEVDASDFTQAEAAVSEKYGNPALRKVSTVKNRMGATFDQIKVEWRRDGSLLVGSKRATSVDKGSFMLTSERALDEHARKRKDAAKSGAKDM